jgi:tripartite-type tricarboxylate transporter receptor subunit TctC
MLAPAKTPAPIVARLAQEIKAAATHPKFIAALAPQGMEIVASSPEEMAQAMREGATKWGDVIRKTGVTINQ